MEKDYNKILENVKEKGYFSITYKMLGTLECETAIILAVIHNLTKVFPKDKIDGYVWIDTLTIVSLLNGIGLSTYRKKVKWLEDNEYIKTKIEMGTSRKHYKTTRKTMILLNLATPLKNNKNNHS